MFPSLKMARRAFNLEEIHDQIGEEWDAVAHRLRPFINQDLFGENIINIVTSRWRQHPEIDTIKRTIRRYYLLRYRDLFVYRHDDLVMVASLFKDGTFESSGEEAVSYTSTTSPECQIETRRKTASAYTSSSMIRIQTTQEQFPNCRRRKPAKFRRGLGDYAGKALAAGKISGRPA
jgi:hypothetical protein